MADPVDIDKVHFFSLLVSTAAADASAFVAFLIFFVSPNSVCVPLCILAYARNGNAGGESPVVDCCQAQALAVGMWAKTVEASGAAAATTSAVQSGSAVPIQLKKPRQPRHYGRRPARRASWPSGGEEDAARGSA